MSPAFIDNMMYVGDTPWHKQGIRVQDAPTIEEALQYAKLGWKVNKRKTYYFDNNIHTQAMPTGGYCTYRADTGQVLGKGVSERYGVLQNEEAFAPFEPLLDMGFKLETAGSVQDGRKVWILAKSPERYTVGNSSNSMSPHGVFSCEGNDRWIAITITNNKEWHQLINLMNNPILANNPDFETFEGRKKSESEIHKHIQNWTKNQQEYPLMKLLQSNGIPAGVIQTTKDLLENDPGFAESHVHEFSHPEVDTITVHKETINISNTQPIFKRAPLIGEDTDQILNNLLGLEEKHINDLYIREILK